MPAPKPLLANVPVPEAAHHQGGAAIANEFRIPAGMLLAQHKHRYDHLAILASGTVLLDVDGVQAEHTGPACLLIKANTHHGVRAITDVVWFCVHAESDADAEALIISANRKEMQAVVGRLNA